MRLSLLCDLHESPRYSYWSTPVSLVCSSFNWVLLRLVFISPGSVWCVPLFLLESWRVIWRLKSFIILFLWRVLIKILPAVFANEEYFGGYLTFCDAESWCSVSSFQDDEKQQNINPRRLKYEVRTRISFWVLGLWQFNNQSMKIRVNVPVVAHVHGTKWHNIKSQHLKIYIELKKKENVILVWSLQGWQTGSYFTTPVLNISHVTTYLVERERLKLSGSESTWCLFQVEKFWLCCSGGCWWWHHP